MDDNSMYYGRLLKLKSDFVYICVLFTRSEKYQIKITLLYSFKSRRYQMILEHYSMTKCHLCHMGSPQSKIILKTLLKELSYLTENHRIFIQQTNGYQDNQGFLHLIRMIDLDRGTLNSPSSTCKHGKMYNLFKKKMNCNSNTLNYICEITASKISERCYHLWLLESQVRNIAQRNNFNKISQIIHQHNRDQKSPKNEFTKSFFEAKLKEQSQKLPIDQKSNKEGFVTTLFISQATLQTPPKKMSSDGIDHTFQSP